MRIGTRCLQQTPLQVLYFKCRSRCTRASRFSSDISFTSLIRLLDKRGNASRTTCGPTTCRNICMWRTSRPCETSHWPRSTPCKAPCNDSDRYSVRTTFAHHRQGFSRQPKLLLAQPNHSFPLRPCFLTAAKVHCVVVALIFSMCHTRQAAPPSPIRNT